MKRFISASLLVIALVIFVTPAFAMELWDPHLRGIDEGLGAGLVPPKGFYFINNSYFTPHWNVYDNDANKTRTHLDGYIDVPVFVFSPGIKLFGADYACAIAQPFDYVNLTAYTPTGENIGAAQGGLYNTVVVPFILSWALPHNFHIAPNLGIYLNDGTTSPPDEPKKPSVVAQSSNGYYALEPGVGITWLYKGWNLSANLHIVFPFKNQDTDYLSGIEFSADYTVARTIGKWTFGVGAYQQNQLTNDRYNGQNVSDYPVTSPYYKPGGNKAANFGIGPLIGYNFGPVDIMATYNFNVYTKNEPGGDFFNVRLVIPFKI